MVASSIVRLAARTDGELLSTEQIVNAGFSASTARRWVAEGGLARVAPDLFRIADRPAPVLQLAVAALRYCRRRDECAVLSGEVALGAAGVQRMALTARPLVLVSHGVRIRLPDAFFDVRQTRLPCRLAMRINGVSVAHPVRALADLAMGTPRGTSSPDDRTLLQGYYDAVNANLIEPVEAVRRWESMGRHPGASRLRGLAATGALEFESHGERTAFLEVFARFPPAPDCQVQVTAKYRADFAYLFSGLILEYYGEEAHAGRVDRDARRAFDLRRESLDVLVLTKSMVRDAAALAAHVHATRRDRERRIIAGELPRPALPPQPPRLSPLRTLGPLG